ncbi:MAG: hypothetical protein MR935_06270 [Agathobaculum sp.]|nr:hypothetical protein [Agathobaculum sp.]
MERKQIKYVPAFFQGSRFRIESKRQKSKPNHKLTKKPNTSPVFVKRAAFSGISLKDGDFLYRGAEFYENNNQKGAGHVDGTSVWDGNITLCGHNRGSWPY